MIKPEDILDAIGELDEKLIAASDEYKEPSQNSEKSKSNMVIFMRRITRFGSLAAVLVLCVIAIRVIPNVMQGNFEAFAPQDGGSSSYAGPSATASAGAPAEAPSETAACEEPAYSNTTEDLGEYREEDAVCETASPEDFVDREKTEETEAYTVPSTGDGNSYDYVVILGDEMVNDFSLDVIRALRAEDESGGKNISFSPLSAAYVLTMAMMGSEGETYEQISDVLGMNYDIADDYFYTLLRIFDGEGEGDYLNIANSLWINENIPVELSDRYTKYLAAQYLAEFYRGDFSEGTLGLINNWVREKTEGKIDEFLDEIDPDTMLCLLNAIYFHAAWEAPYEEQAVKPDTFTLADGETVEAQFMNSIEYVYLEDSNTTGFMKYYEDEAFAYVALLPEEGIDMDTYLAELTGAKIENLLDTAQNTGVMTSMPKYSMESDMSLKDILISLGVTDAFDPSLADFSIMTGTDESYLHIDDVKQKTFIDVNESGTTAAAATAVTMKSNGLAAMPDTSVILDRPYVYMIIGTTSRVPAFMGVVMNPAEE